LRRYFELSPQLQFLAWLLLVIALKFDVILAPPVWDTAMGVFPPAAFLYDTGFDIVSLATQADWWSGGANVHSFSLWTWLTAVVMSVTDDPLTTFATLHIATFILNAFAISIFVKILFEYTSSAPIALTSGLLLLLTPLVLVQIGYMYFESIVMCLGVLTWASWHRQREGVAVILAIVALSVKLTGVSMVVILSLVLLIRLVSSFSYTRLALLLSLPTSFYIITSVPEWFGALNNGNLLRWGDQAQLLQGVIKSLGRVPEISGFILLGAVVSIVYVVSVWRSVGWASLAAYCQKIDRTESSQIIALVYPFVFCTGVYFSTYMGFLLLPRYLLPILPFVLVQLALGGHRFNFQPVLLSVLLIACIGSIYNHNGILYSRSGAFSLVERSHAYKPYVRAQKTIIGEIDKLPRGIPIYVSREIDYMTSNRMMGYSKDPNPYIFGIYTKKFRYMAIEQLADEYYVVLSNGGHGGKRIKQILKMAQDSDEWQVTNTYKQNIGGYNMHIHHLHRL